MFAVAGLVLLAVLAVLAVALLRARNRPRQAPLSTRRAWLLVIAGGVASPVLAILAVTWSGLLIGERTETGPGAGALTVEVTGRLWWWEIRYLDGDGEVIAVTANEMHVPVGQRTEVVLLSDNVIHSFWVPSLQGKTDMIPGRINRTWIEPLEVGTYRGQCAEFCGLQHALMAFAVVAEPEEAFEAWLEHQGRTAEVPQRPELLRGQEVFMEVGCGDCHAVRGTAADGRLGPDLTHFASRESLAAVTIPNTEGHLAGWITDPQHVKPGALMPAVPIPAGDLQPLLAYLGSLE